jgi:cysteine desulfurase family protein (TIGR01976 family)
LPFNRDTFEFDLDDLDDIITERTRLICVGGASNLTGTINNVKAVCAKARAAGAMSFIDGVQSAPHIATDVTDIGCDFFICSAYKFFGPHQGILWGRRELLEQLEPYKVRPAPSSIPGCFETGTQSHEGFAGISATVDYFASIGASMGGVDAGEASAASGRRAEIRTAMNLLFAYEEQLATHLVAGLQSIDGVTVQGITAPDAMNRRVPTVSFTHRSAAPSSVAEGLARENIFVWSGHNYAVEVAKSLGIFESGGAVRIGPVHYNSIAEIDELLAVLPGLLAG